ncbi:hypothetical protein LTR62_005800 [Meristemomyces frigidus]|uniref:Aminoglycoside phosphotransferase domain-containing protein n=1 Tax=Meristemomyces frigidus TaxID=1508187 RepID=A0AAN7TE34_9PEZI|nr:hypothetical protein LTR62_005800 [Meristemomyces frigidus]
MYSTLLQPPNPPDEPPQLALSAPEIKACHNYASHHFPSHTVEPTPQGACSYILLLTPFTSSNALPTILQFRLPQYALPSQTLTLPHRVYGALAPQTKELASLPLSKRDGVQVLSMSCIPGSRFSDLQPGRTADLSPRDLGRMGQPMRSFASFFAGQWATRSSSLGCDGAGGRVGGSLVTRLYRLERELPAAQLRAVAREVWEAVEAGGLDACGLVFTHGDLLSANVIVDPETWRIQGIVDWAESEVLSFGLGLYGLEHLLGFIGPSAVEKEGQEWIYYSQADELRRIFWRSFHLRIPGGFCGEGRRAVELGFKVGVLLWHGFAWDEGRIDRVVGFERDGVEVEYLYGFLGVACEGVRRDSTVEECTMVG